ncbi:MAG: DUF5666 domain-containing protein [candidate division KSB1 bacterium]|nr:DUF5666 domain-containing protein [candidate division KSB1 bacterium]
MSPSPSPNPTDVAFKVFFIAEARVELDRDPGEHRFEVEGRFILGQTSDGIEVLRETVAVKFGDFAVTIPAGSFCRNDDNDGFKFENRAAGIKEIEIKDDGRFEVEGRDLNLANIELSQPVSFSLRIGNDFGETRIPFDRNGRFKNPNPFPSPSPSPTVSPSPSPSPTVSPSPSPSPTVSPSPSPSPTVSPSPSPSPTVSPSPSPSPTVSPSPSPSPTVSPSPSPSPTVSPSPSPSPTVSPSPSPSPELHLRGPIQALVVRGPNDGEVTVGGVRFIVTSHTRLEDENGNTITLNAFVVGEEVDAWGPPAANNTTTATRIRKR